MNEKLVSHIFAKAEIGEWESFTFEQVSKELKIKITEIKKLFPDKESFLAYYNDCVDTQVIGSLTTEDIKSVEKAELLKEYFMSKLDSMNKYKLGFANILNCSYKNSKFVLINLKANKKSIKVYTKELLINKSCIKKQLFIKVLMSVWILAFQRWLYEGDDNSSSYAFIDKSFKFLDEKTTLFS